MVNCFLLTLSVCCSESLNSTLDCTLWTLYRSYFKGISANIELQVYSETYFLFHAKLKYRTVLIKLSFNMSRVVSGTKQ
jgi:hypothetical protein